MWNFILGPQTPVYEGMIVVLHSRATDLNVKPTTGKRLTNTRSSGTDESTKLTPQKLNFWRSVGIYRMRWMSWSYSSGC